MAHDKSSNASWSKMKWIEAHEFGSPSANGDVGARNSCLLPDYSNS